MNAKNLPLLLVLLAMLAAASTAGASFLLGPINPTDDEDPNAINPTAVYDNNTTIYVANNDSNSATPREIFMKFTLPAADQYVQGTVSGAQIGLLTQTNDLGTNTVNGIANLTLWSTASTWDESTLNWNTRPLKIANLAFTNTGSVASPAGMYTAGWFTFSSAALDAYLNTFAPGASVAFAITIAHQATTETNDYIRFHSSEAATQANRPYLQFTADIPEPAAIALTLVGAMLLVPMRRRTR